MKEEKKVTRKTEQKIDMKIQPPPSLTPVPVIKKPIIKKSNLSQRSGSPSRKPTTQPLFNLDLVRQSFPKNQEKIIQLEALENKIKSKDLTTVYKILTRSLITGNLALNEYTSKKKVEYQSNVDSFV